ncbi:MAG TPA: hypothetical protein VHT05_14420 [Candidatus Elarobacter sp.]|jgi:hypothetical protein|nr:hypothetical protein [Candidatus Elarobacter sp.]
MRTLAFLLAAAIGTPVVAFAAPSHDGARDLVAVAQHQPPSGPRSAQVHLHVRGRVVTTTLGALQDQHKAIVASFAHAAQQGAKIAATLDGTSAAVVGAPGTNPTTPPG